MLEEDAAFSDAAMAPTMAKLLAPSARAGRVAQGMEKRDGGAGMRRPGAPATVLAVGLLVAGLVALVFLVVRWVSGDGEPSVSAPEPSTAEQIAPAVQVSVATVSVGSVPSGAEVLVDGDLAGNAPMVLELSPGAHHIEVRSKGYRTAHRDVRLEAGDSESWAVHLEPARLGDGRGRGRISLETSPRARVWLQGRDLGETPLESVDLPSGTIPLQFELPDGSRVIRSVYVPLDGENRAFVDLRRALRP